MYELYWSSSDRQHDLEMGRFKTLEAAKAAIPAAEKELQEQAGYDHEHDPGYWNIFYRTEDESVEVYEEKGTPLPVDEEAEAALEAQAMEGVTIEDDGFVYLRYVAEDGEKVTRAFTCRRDGPGYVHEVMDDGTWRQVFDGLGRYGDALYADRDDLASVIKKEWIELYRWRQEARQ